MDLRQHKLSAAQIEEVQQFILQRKLAYQPFIFTDTLQVGEGQRFRDGEFSDKCGEVLWEGHPPELDEIPNLITQDVAAFQDANGELRTIYDAMVDCIVRNVGDDISKLSFAEFGCNTGYFMHSLAARRAGKTIGYDFTPNAPIFRWFNDVLGIPQERNEFRLAEWDSLSHCVRYCTFDEVDVCLSIAVTCHLADPLHHLAFLCSKARKAVFFWCPVEYRDDLSISLGTPGKYPNSLSYPINFDNEVRMSVPLLRLTLERCGFGNLIELAPPDVSPQFQKWFHNQKGFLALRTECPSTLYVGGKNRRAPYCAIPESIVEDLPAWARPVAPNAVVEAVDPRIAVLMEEDYRGFNIVRFRSRFVGLSQAVGPVDFEHVDDAWLSARTETQQACLGESVEDVKRRIDHITIDELTDKVRQLQERLDQPPSLKRFASLRRKALFR